MSDIGQGTNISVVYCSTGRYRIVSSKIEKQNRETIISQVGIITVSEIFPRGIPLVPRRQLRTIISKLRDIYVTSCHIFYNASCSVSTRIRLCLRAVNIYKISSVSTVSISQLYVSVHVINIVEQTWRCTDRKALDVVLVSLRLRRTISIG